MAYFLEQSDECTSLGISWDYVKALDIAQESVSAYQTFKNKNIRTSVDIWGVLDSYDACFKLLEMQFKYRLKIMKIDDFDMQKMKDLLLLAHRMEDSLNLLRIMLDKFHSVFVWENELKIGRIFLMLSINCYQRMKISERFIMKYVQDSGKKEGVDLHIKFCHKYSELLFLSAYSIASCKIVKQDLKHDEKRDARELLFRDVLKILDVEDVFPTLPDTVQHLEHAQILFNIMEPKIVEIQELYARCIVKKVAGPTPLTSSFIQFLRGQIYHDLSCFQTDLQKQIKLAEKSIEEWDALLEDSFSLEDLKEYVDIRVNNNGIHLFVNITQKNHLNYKRVIDYKTANAMKLDPDDSNTGLFIRELNMLRRNFCLHMQKILNFADLKPDFYSGSERGRLYLMIGVQYRSIILKNKKNQESNLDKSILYFQKHDACLHDSIGTPKDKRMPSTILANIYSSSADQDAFIRKFRKD